ncbi:MAG: c-type cytochrome [Woeseia sp.]|nr:c-type cytochrome [Woeseia sp.]
MAAAASIVGIAACEGGIVPTQQIVLPEGNAERGQQAFVALECTACHTVSGMELAAPEEFGPVTIALGGRVSKVKSYNELVTSVINPSHRLARNPFRQQIEEDGESIMPVYGDIMTVTQLVDIVTFLQSKYEGIERPGYKYPVYEY